MSSSGTSQTPCSPTPTTGRGYLFIFNVEVDREGSRVDVDNLKRTFEAMGAVVDEKNDPRGTNIKSIMGELKKFDFTNFSYVAIAYFSHGTENDYVCTASSAEIIRAQKAILLPLCNNESLNGKLKWLIMQTCRGSYDFIKQKPEGPPSAIKYPNYYLKFFATSQNMKAYRDVQYGTWFIQALCKRLLQEYKDQDIATIMEHTKRDVMARNHDAIVQIPELESNLAGKRFYITTGLSMDS